MKLLYSKYLKIVNIVYSKFKNYNQLVEMGQADIVLMPISSNYLHPKVPSFFRKLNQISAYNTSEFMNLNKEVKCTFDL